MVIAFVSSAEGGASSAPLPERLDYSPDRRHLLIRPGGLPGWERR